MRILLIEPPPPTALGTIRVIGSMGTPKADIAWAPLDLMIISGFLEKNGIPSIISDANANMLGFQEVKEIIKEKLPQVVIFTTSTTSIYNDLKIATVSKEVSQAITTVAIGSHIMVLPEETLRENIHLDIAVYSEPELPILELIKSDLSPTKIKGICYRAGDEIVRNEPSSLCQNLDEFGFPAHHKVPFHLYRDPMIKRRPMTLTTASRGCVNACIFCCSPLYGNYRKRSVPHVVEELEWIIELGIRELNFFDPGLTYDSKWANRLFDEMIKRKMDLTWKANARADHLDYDMALKMKEAGCHTVQIGAESADLKILKNIRKNITPDMVRKAVSSAKKAGLETLVYFSLGWPGETKETMKKTIKFAKSLKTDLITLGQATPHPGTAFYDYVEKNNYLKTRDWRKFDPMYKPVFSYPHLSNDDIYNAVIRGYWNFYMRPTYILRRLLRLRSILDIKKNLINFCAFFNRYILKKI